jgi:uncharacterized Rmd1/YagE family protein
VFSALKSNLRRRNSAGAAGASSSSAVSPGGLLPARIGPQRTTKNAQKLKLLPNPEVGDDEDEESGRDVYSQYTRIKDPTARRDAARLGKADRARLPRVTAYCTANRYNLEGLMRFLKGRGKSKGASPKRIDECIYTPYSYESEWSRERRLGPRDRQDSGFVSQTSDVVDSSAQDLPYERRHSTGSTDATTSGFRRGGLLMSLDGHHDQSGGSPGYGNGFSEGELLDESATVDHEPDFDIQVHMPEIFLFEYGVVVIWGMSTAQEVRFLKETSKFELESLPADQLETECFNFYYTREYQPRIYNDFITLRDKYNYMTKLAISHALAQSVKTSLFEESIATTIETCKEIPEQIARTGNINLSRTQINMQIGELFILRISVHLNGAVLDSPELFWVEPQLEPVYLAVRSYLEMDQRVGLLTDRLDVVADLLAVLKEQLNHGHGEKLEWIGEFTIPLRRRREALFRLLPHPAASIGPTTSLLTISSSHYFDCRRDSRRGRKYRCGSICRCLMRRSHEHTTVSRNKHKGWAAGCQSQAKVGE